METKTSAVLLQHGTWHQTAAAVLGSLARDNDNSLTQLYTRQANTFFAPKVSSDDVALDRSHILSMVT